MSSLLAQGPAPIEVPAIDYGALLPLLVILTAACLAVLVEAFLPRYQRWPAQVVLSVVAIAVAGIALAAYASTSPPQGLTTVADALAVRGIAVQHIQTTPTARWSPAGRSSRRRRRGRP